MTITKQILSDQVRVLDLHQGDSLRVVSEVGPTLLIQIIKAATSPDEAKKGHAGNWARKYAGVAQPSPGQTTEDAREAHYQEKYGA